MITANNPTGSPVGGRIGSVAAWDEISGLVQASHSIQLVRSGDAVTATVIAPYIGSIIEHDSTITTAYPYPTTPDSIKPEVLAESQAAYDQVLAARTGIADDISALLADFTAQKTQALADLAQQQAAVDAVLSETATALQEKLTDKAGATFKAQTAAARASSEEIAKLRELAHNEKEALEKARDAANSTGDTAYQRALDQRDQVIVQLADHDQQMLELKNQNAQAAVSARVARTANWDAVRKTVLTQIGAGIQSGASLVQDADSDPRGFWSYFLDPEFWRGEGGDLYMHYLWNPGELDTDLWYMNNVAYGMTGTGFGGLAGLGTGAAIGALGALAGSGTTATALAGGLGGGLAGSLVGRAIGGIAGDLGRGIGSFGGGLSGGYLGWDGARAVRAAQLAREAAQAGSQGCFVAGTLVHTDGGPIRIETITEGTLVWGYDRECATWTLKRVVVPQAREYNGDIVSIGINGSQLEATGNHPFWVTEGDELDSRPPVGHVDPNEHDITEHGRWVEARNLRIGDTLLSQRGHAARVETLAVSHRNVSVYNIEVEEVHNYSVGALGVLVHNNSSPFGNFGGDGARTPQAYPGQAKEWAQRLRDLDQEAARLRGGVEEWLAVRNFEMADAYIDDLLNVIDEIARLLGG